MKRLGLKEGLKIGEPKIWKILFFYEFCKDGRMSYQSSSLSLPRGVYDPKDKEAEEEENKNSPFPLSRSCFMTSKYSSLDLAVAKSAEAWAFWARKRVRDWSCRGCGSSMPCLLFKESHNITANLELLFSAAKESYHLTLYLLIKIT